MRKIFIICIFGLSGLLYENSLFCQYANLIYKAELLELDDRSYPDNPDKPFRHKNYTKINFQSIVFNRNDLWHFDITLVPNKKQFNAKVVLPNINLFEFIPAIPVHLRDDPFLSKIAAINQEWNRNQVNFDPHLYYVEADKKALRDRISRVEIARSCLNSYLWEVFLFTKEASKDILIYHGWFTFPKKLYQQLFEFKNDIPFPVYAPYLEEWVDLEPELVDLNEVREVIFERDMAFHEDNDSLYPMLGEQLKKEETVLWPRQLRSMKQLQNDKSLFASFVAPGIYTKDIPRSTELSRFRNLRSAKCRQTKIHGSKSKELEIELNFESHDGRKTTLIVGGINIKNIQSAVAASVHSGNKYAMGFSTHSFYEDYGKQLRFKSLFSPFFSVLLDEKGRWMDSHKIGIDGTILHRDARDNSKLHLWILSYERHAIIGHYHLALPYKEMMSSLPVKY